MSLTLNSNDARKADSFATVIRESGKYVGTITRAEKLLSKNKVEGVGFSFKTDDNASANYLDLYTVKPNGEKLRGYSIVQAIMCCTKVKSADDGKITFDRWDTNERRMVQATADGYPALMGKRIGLVLQKELATHSVTGEDTERLNIVAVFEPATGLMASEILDQKTKGERLEGIVKMIQANPVRDTRKRNGGGVSRTSDHPHAPGNDSPPFDDSIPF
jgi:hypothetical protein